MTQQQLRFEKHVPGARGGAQIPLQKRSLFCRHFKDVGAHNTASTLIMKVKAIKRSTTPTAAIPNQGYPRGYFCSCQEGRGKLT